MAEASWRSLRSIRFAKPFYGDAYAAQVRGVLNSAGLARSDPHTGMQAPGSDMETTVSQAERKARPSGRRHVVAVPDHKVADHRKKLL